MKRSWNAEEDGNNETTSFSTKGEDILSQLDRGFQESKDSENDSVEIISADSNRRRKLAFVKREEKGNITESPSLGSISATSVATKSLHSSSSSSSMTEDNTGNIKKDKEIKNSKKLNDLNDLIKLTAKTGGNEDIEDIIPNPINGLENKNVLESLFIPFLSDTTTTTAQRHPLRSQSRTNPISTAPSSSSIANPDIPLICSRTSISRRDKCFMCKYYFQHAFSNRETTSEGCKRCGKDFGVQLPICHRTECWKDHLSHIHDPILGLRIRDLINRQRSQIGLSRFEFASKTVQSIYSKSKKRK